MGFINAKISYSACSTLSAAWVIVVKVFSKAICQHSVPLVVLLVVAIIFDSPYY